MCIQATTHTDDGIDTVRWLYDEETDGSRASDPAIPQVMILFTDGNATRPKRLVESIYHLERAVSSCFLNTRFLQTLL